METHRDAFIQEVAEAVLRGRPQLHEDREALVERVGQWLFQLMSLTVAGVVRHISSAVGADTLSRTFREIVEQHGKESASYEFVDLSIKLDLNRTFPRTEIDKLAGRMKGDIFARSVLQKLVIHNVRIFPDLSRSGSSRRPN